MFRREIYSQHDGYQIWVWSEEHKDIPAEDVIANGGKGNKVSYIKNPKLFCDATYFFAENLFGDVFNSLDENME